jgi:hypothetical protein
MHTPDAVRQDPHRGYGPYTGKRDAGVPELAACANVTMKLGGAVECL